jgi:hypothetical protein
MEKEKKGQVRFFDGRQEDLAASGGGGPGHAAGSLLKPEPWSGKDAKGLS